MKFDNVYTLAGNDELTGLPEASPQFCPIYDNEAEAIEAATCEVADTNIEDVVVISKSAEDRRVTVVCGTKGIYVVIPCAGALEGYYEVTVGRHNFEVVTSDRRVTLANVLYSSEGRECYKGVPVNIRQLLNLTTIEVLDDGRIYDRVRHGYRPVFAVPKNCPNYARYKTAITIGKEAVQPVHHLVYSAFNGISLDLVKLLTNKKNDWCDWYRTSDNYDIAAARTIRQRGKGAVWGIDHIDQNPRNNAYANLQLCTDNANSVLAKLRKSNFKVLALDED